PTPACQWRRWRYQDRLLRSIAMRKQTREQYNAYLQQVAMLNGVDSATEKFTVDPSVQQTLETKMQESSEFLNRINIIGVTEQKGEKLGLGIGSPIASTTNTA